MKELINSLIDIDRLDSAFQNMREALDGFRLRLRRECMNFDDQSVEALKEEIRTMTQKQEESETQVDEISRRLSTLEEERRTLEVELAAMEPLRNKKNELEERKADLIKYVKTKLSEMTAEAEELRQVIKKARGYLPILASKGPIESEAGALEKEEQTLGQARAGLASDLRGAKAAAERVQALKDEIRQETIKVKKLNEKARQRGAEITRLMSIAVPTRETTEQLRRRLDHAEHSAESLKDNLTRIGVVLRNYRTIQKDGKCPT